MLKSINKYSPLKPSGFSVFVALGVLLRLTLFATTPTHTAFDNHFEPIKLWLVNGVKPGVDQCFECFQPPLFYYFYYFVSKFLTIFNLEWVAIQPLLQFVHVLMGLATLLFTWLFLKNIEIEEKYKRLVFLILVFLPRHIYMSVMFTNDSMVFMWGAFVAWRLMVYCKHPTWKSSLLIALGVIGAIFTKGNGLIVLPATFLFLGLWWLNNHRNLKALKQVISVGLIVVLAYGPFLWMKQKELGNPYKMNIEILKYPINQQPAKRLDYFSFNPISFLPYPVLLSDNISSFFTVIYSRMWVEAEPMYSVFIDKEQDGSFWYNQFIWLNNSNSDLKLNPKTLSKKYIYSNSLLILLGLFPLVLILLGAFKSLKDILSKKGNSIYLFAWILVLGNLAGIVLTTYNYPYYSFVKAAFFLVSIPSFILFAANGAKSISKFSFSNLGFNTFVFVLSLAVTFQIAIISYGAYFKV